MGRVDLLAETVYCLAWGRCAFFNFGPVSFFAAAESLYFYKPPRSCEGDYATHNW